MTRNRKVVAVWAIVGLSVLQLGLAGVAFQRRHATAQQLADEGNRQVELTRQVEGAREAKVEAPVVPKSTWQLLDGPDVSGTLQILQSLGDAAGVEFASAKAAPSSTVGRQSFQLTGRGRPAAVCEFLAGIEQHSRLIVVETGKVSPGDAELIAFELGIATYHAGGAR